MSSDAPTSGSGATQAWPAGWAPWPLALSFPPWAAQAVGGAGLGLSAGGEGGSENSCPEQPVVNHFPARASSSHPPKVPSASPTRLPDHQGQERPQGPPGLTLLVWGPRELRTGPRSYRQRGRACTLSSVLSSEVGRPAPRAPGHSVLERPSHLPPGRSSGGSQPLREAGGGARPQRRCRQSRGLSAGRGRRSAGESGWDSPDAGPHGPHPGPGSGARRSVLGPRGFPSRALPAVLTPSRPRAGNPHPPWPPLPPRRFQPQEGGPSRALGFARLSWGAGPAPLCSLGSLGRGRACCEPPCPPWSADGDETAPQQSCVCGGGAGVDRAVKRPGQGQAGWRHRSQGLAPAGVPPAGISVPLKVR